MSAAAPEHVVRFLDDLRAAETAASEVIAAWIDVCGLEGLRGGLRAIGEREAGHATLLADRVRELGGVCTAMVAEPVRAAALSRFGSSAVGDDEKLRALAYRYPDDAVATSPIHRILEELGDDAETRELLRLIADAEAATVAWLRAYHLGLHPGASRRIAPRVTAPSPTAPRPGAPRASLGAEPDANVGRFVDAAGAVPQPAKPARQN